ncbi:bifunctional DNA-formamidopyrimidine glycosylase/DNA-(apurinic or apyrimidinic site) lyase [bacterium (Candidatus Blackallbacteria) CG17_big_fil_post_rev_8_21_14_2_50_48_46]|uniref:Formamidopyrimidine-DNA glycosylase n=1 Tax=bacterium (Candidatus Blackallbacteria) CG17_big_fil_post_rev_8_21_14_2_50_48_46 TaxID=2014261 RepID=A0A2M7FY96_9BACT|nr:MAG: bifunctional DNA-formamidopyrimidine glycosylase/DNA-(apurinic or apyrimidinic site) lyase [bacterium (Candidatus Blackallbacteria) CG18_big_fil_WC_8_21_14_2_50_49_26]PIW14297.1 MAG: bifunctional DNA-formamidopyrimidine glycosylase/DNA-(apurinic or apyrimidinic site) lyase [bacterium (Candidatus Blackallbacteria) CG17_big_fil_post_rev_8_21_14_2_50_48_46]PIW45566.1 MAG: bifunctional DNA-formamidopyrimidine glycosylase/DNA-(apurinic or apyrimidinic site) lyase [bacterium (Candidatus Blackal
MPELPEVEVVRQGLEAQLLHKQIEGVEIYTPHITQPDPESWSEALTGQKLMALERRAKYLILRLSQDCLLVHLRMTGQMLLQANQSPQAEPREALVLPFTYYRKPVLDLPDKHTHLRLGFSGGIQLYFRDIRKFGRVEKLLPEALTEHPGLAKLGVEPLGSEYTWKHFQGLLQGQRAIKAFLLDQTRIAGLGNIYVDEALFEAGIRPQRPVASLRPAEAKRLFAAIPKILEKAIASGGTTLKDYLHPDGKGGEHQEELKVYGRGKMPCLRCGQLLEKTVVAQRGTHFCAHCQQ